MAAVSPRLLSELERGKRAHVSFDTAMRLLHLVGVSVSFAPRTASEDETARSRAERRRQLWTGKQSTLMRREPPPPPPDADARLTAVASASRQAAGLRAAHRVRKNAAVLDTTA